MTHTKPIPSTDSRTGTITQRIFAALVNPPGHSRIYSAAIVVGLTALVGSIYVLSEGGLSRQAFYIIPMILAVSWLGLWWGLSVAIFSTMIRLYGDFAFGGVVIEDTDAFYSAIANRLSLLLVNFVVIIVLNELYMLNRQLEERVQSRTTALRQATETRERLQASLFEAGQRERKSIGRDLHDGLGQHLTATAMAASILASRLAARGDPLATDAREIESLVKSGIDQSRQFARGLLLETVKPDELLSELEELAVSTSSQHKTACTFSAAGSSEQLDVNASSHLFYIAREAVSNALRHSGATRVAIHFNVNRAIVGLTVTDNGRGLQSTDASRGGMGLHVMSQRAELMGGELIINNVPEGGTRIDCRVPLATA